jgi:2-polyprenyl-6-methoxyphenol hydroxylase-like FAD-dependent oxidoreductase
MKSKFTIIGGGIAGLTTAIALQRAGFESVVFEAAPEFREVGAGIALSVNAMKALAALGLDEEIGREEG